MQGRREVVRGGTRPGPKPDMDERRDARITAQAKTRCLHGQHCEPGCGVRLSKPDFARRSFFWGGTYCIGSKISFWPTQALTQALPTTGFPCATPRTNFTVRLMLTA